MVSEYLAKLGIKGQRSLRLGRRGQHKIKEKQLKNHKANAQLQAPVDYTETQTKMQASQAKPIRELKPESSYKEVT